MNVYQDIINSPIGNLMIEASDKGLTRLSMTDNTQLPAPKTNEIIIAAKEQLEEYFHGERKIFDLPLDLEDHSDFYKKVWQALVQVSYGSTKTYSDIARQLGDVKAVRAVGMANGRNPIAIIVPCHRIVGINGKLVGYAWGIEVKKWLLLHEMSHSPVPVDMLF